jgi:hypothetical protein
MVAVEPAAIVPSVPFATLKNDTFPLFANTPTQFLSAAFAKNEKVAPAPARLRNTTWLSLAVLSTSLKLSILLACSLHVFIEGLSENFIDILFVCKGL